MFKNFVVIIIAMGTLFATSACSESGLKVKKLSKTVLDNLPAQNRHPKMDMSNGYIGMIKGDYPQNRFLLFDSVGNQILKIECEEGKPFAYVDMRSCDGVVFLAARKTETVFIYSAYDYAGNVVLSPFRAENLVKPSPSLKYLYSLGISAYATPEVYDQDGKLLGKPIVKTAFWELIALNDSLLLLQDRNRFQIISVPSMAVEREFTIEGISPSIYTALSDDRNFYAFIGRSKTAVCNLTTGEVYFARKEEHYVSELRIALSPHAEYLIYYAGQVITIDRLGEKGYERIVDNLTAPLGGPVIGWHNGPFFSGDFCVLNYHHRTTAGVGFRSFIFNYRNLPESISEAVALDGYVSRADPDIPTRFNILVTSSKENKTPYIETFELEEVRDE